MCRFVSYIGKKIHLADLLFKPYNSLVNQSQGATESLKLVHGDGFGVSWYIDSEPEPLVYKTKNPAWSDANLKNLAEKTSSSCILAHARAATEGEISRLNCHPFQYNNLLMAHNGGIRGFKDIKRHLRPTLCDETYNWIKGQTDSEHFFALFLNELNKRKNQTMTADAIATSLLTTIRQIEELVDNYALDQHICLNTIITDEHHLIATRYIANTDLKAPSLHYVTGNHYECIHDDLQIPAEQEHAPMLLVSSEQLTKQTGASKMLPPNHMLIYTSGQPLQIIAI